MDTLTLQVADRHTADARFLQAMTTGRPVGAYITFPTVQALEATLTDPRWDIVRAMCSAGPLTLPEVARRVGRDVKGVHNDMHALMDAGVLEKAEGGRVVFPYDAVHVDSMMPPAA